MSLEDVTLETLENYLQYRSKGLKAASMANKTSILKQFFFFLTQEEWIDSNPAAHLSLPKGERTLPRHLRIESMEKLFDAAKQGISYTRNGDGLRLRDQTMITLLYASGLRVSELVTLQVSMIDFKEGYLRVKGKGGKERITPFPSHVGKLISSYLESSWRRSFEASPYVFLNKSGEPLSRQSVFHVIKELAVYAGIKEEISPHTLRHSFATHLLQSGMGLRSLQLLLGHSDLSTTQIYAHMTPQHLKIAQQKFHPRG